MARDITLVIDKKQGYLLLLKTIKVCLYNAGCIGQSDFIQRLIELIDQNKIELFISQINSVDMWGGSGAVWEVNIEDIGASRQFEFAIIQLIDLMENTGIIGKRIIQIRRIFVRNQKNK